MNIAQPLNRLLLVLLLLAGNWANAEHSAAADFDHYHSSECIFGLSQTYIHTSFPAALFILDLNTDPVVAKKAAGFYYARLKTSGLIRAPPVH